MWGGFLYSRRGLRKWATNKLLAWNLSKGPKFYVKILFYSQQWHAVWFLSHLVNSLWYFFWCACIMFSYRHGFTFDPTCISSKWSQAEAILPCTCVLHVSPVRTHYILWWKHLDHQQVDGVFNNCTKPCLTLNGVLTALFQVNIPFITRGESANFSLIPSLRLSLGSFIDIS